MVIQYATRLGASFGFSFGENGFGLSGSLLKNRKHICWLNRINRCIEHTIWIDKKIIIEELLWLYQHSRLQSLLRRSPSTKQKLSFAFLVREEKILYMALEGQDAVEIQNAVITVLNDCILTPNVDIVDLATFDVEYLFLQLRGKSVGETVEVILRHKESQCLNQLHFQ